ncbi:MAG: acyl-[acyl-carrier-protein]--UDP-N-acetylglucosamine O-acyltransferase, partial [Betaproteobacteria bacterium]|nr:acyl-[acyl-carrier-protein]--UDP-N-acetylglucosamine O-acyltransferase [Betaproteobacteria bacterium]
PTQLIIGNGNTIREFCTFNAGTVSGGGITRIGHDNLFMAYVHLAHDCQIGSHTIFANNSQLAGHVQVDDWVILGGFTVVRQFLRLGAHSFTAMCSLLFADLPPFVTCEGQPADARTVNAEGLRRRGFSPARIAAVRAMHKALYREGLTLEVAKARIADMAADVPEAQPDVDMMLAFLAGVGKAGIVRRRSRASIN